MTPRDGSIRDTTTARLLELIQVWRSDVDAHQKPADVRSGEAESVSSNRAYNNAMLRCADELEMIVMDVTP